jgi:hypothetical protein
VNLESEYRSISRLFCAKFELMAAPHNGKQNREGRLN